MATSESLLTRLERCLGKFDAKTVTDITSVYTYYPNYAQSKLGTGSYGTAFRMKSVEKPSEPPRAVKVMEKARITRNQTQIQHVLIEIAATKFIQHKHCNRTVAVYQNPHCIYVVMELCDAEKPDITTRLLTYFARVAPSRIVEADGLVKTWTTDADDNALSAFFKDHGAVPSTVPADAPTETKLRALCEGKDDADAQFANLSAKLDQFRNTHFDLKMGEITRDTRNREAPTVQDLFSWIVLLRRFPDEKSSVIIRQVLQALQYLHSCNIVHRDLKTENVVVAEARQAVSIKNDEGEVIGCRITEKITSKLIDFGLAKALSQSFPTSPSPEALSQAMSNANPFESDAPMLVTPCGTEVYCALEAIDGIMESGMGRTRWLSTKDKLPKLDVWGAGTALFCMSAGRPPFRAPRTVMSRMEKMNALRDLMDRGPDYPAHVTDEAKEFIRLLLEKDPSLRPNADGALRHHFLSQASDTVVYEVFTDGTVKFINSADLPKAASTMSIGSERQSSEEVAAEEEVAELAGDDADAMLLQRQAEDDGGEKGSTDEAHE